MLLLTTFLLQHINLLNTTTTKQPNYDIKTNTQRILYNLKDKNETNNLQKIIDELKNIDKLFTH